MISGSEMYEWYSRATFLEEEIKNLQKIAEDAPDYDYFTSPERQYDLIEEMEQELALIKQQIENYGGEYGN